MSRNKKAAGVRNSQCGASSAPGLDPQMPPARDTEFNAKADSPSLFNAIARRYDLLNYILSCGMDIGWRRKMALFLPPGDALTVLDLATGTADVALALVRHGRGVRQVIGVDQAEEMLRLGRNKVERHGLADRIHFEKADALALPFKAGLFDAVTVAFGLRNLPDLIKGFMEIRRVLGPGGRLIVLEFSMPANFLVRPFFYLYLKFIVPAIGYVLTGNHQAYLYLSRTVRDFPSGERFQRIMKQTGFVNVRRMELLFGGATIYVADAPMPVTGGGSQ